MSRFPTPKSDRRRPIGPSILRCRSGMVAVEFALVVPLLIILWTGVIEVGNLLLISSRVVAASQTAADLTAREQCIGNDELTDIFAGLSAVLTPYPDSDATYDLASVVFDPSTGTPSVDWRELRGIADADNDILADSVLNLGGRGDSVIVGTVTYTYTPMFAAILPTDFTFSETAVYRPRRTRAVARQNQLSC